METQVKQRFLVFGKPDIGLAESVAVQKAIMSGWIGYGPLSRQFERKFAEMIHVEHCVAVSSCTIGLVMALKAAGIRPGNRVMVPTLTFAATLNAVLELGAQPILYDHGTEIVVDSLSSISAIVPVHLWGEPVPIDKDITESHIKIIEDAAHAFGGSYEGKALGTFGHFGIFSFYPTKNITTGDGGMVVCKSKEEADLVKTLASQGLSQGAWKRYSDAPTQNYDVDQVGYKGLMNDMAAAMGLVQLERWPEIKEKRSRIFKIYEKEFGPKCEGHSQHIYEIRVKDRDFLRKNLYYQGIGTGVHYKPLHLEPAYKFLGYQKGDFPVAEKIGEETLSLPLSSTMTEEDALRVIEEIKKYGVIA